MRSKEQLCELKLWECIMPHDGLMAIQESMLNSSLPDCLHAFNHRNARVRKCNGIIQKRKETLWTSKILLYHIMWIVTFSIPYITGRKITKKLKLDDNYLLSMDAQAMDLSGRTDVEKEKVVRSFESQAERSKAKVMERRRRHTATLKVCIYRTVKIDCYYNTTMCHYWDMSVK